MIFGKEKVREKMKEISLQGNDAAPKDKDMYDDLEIVLEMYERDVYKRQLLERVSLIMH